LILNPLKFGLRKRSVGISMFLIKAAEFTWFPSLPRLPGSSKLKFVFEVG
jgi:hypothetical protein